MVRLGHLTGNDRKNKETLSKGMAFLVGGEGTWKDLWMIFHLVHIRKY